ncbi:MAG: HAD-IIA family hydrolase [Legionellaceae bacterium]|nr:HAD-IIA family hydrolase [Legionellaceae bacterium]
MNGLNENIRLCVLDLDGTIYIGNQAVDGAIDLIQFIRKQRKVVFFTNGSASSLSQIHTKLNRLGVVCDPHDIYSSAAATLRYLVESELNNVYVIGSAEFCEDLERGGIHIVTSGDADHVVVGLDVNFSYQKMAIALSVLIKGGKFIACNIDRYFPNGKTTYSPGCGAIVGALSAASNRSPDCIVGKPSTYVLSQIAADYQCCPNEIMVIGDSFESDMAMATQYHCLGVLIDPQGEYAGEHNMITTKSVKELLTMWRQF